MPVLVSWTLSFIFLLHFSIARAVIRTQEFVVEETLLLGVEHDHLRTRQEEQFYALLDRSSDK